jgi:hypothetical protein
MHPMIIDTANRQPSLDTGTDPEHTRHGIVPPQSNVGPEAMYKYVCYLTPMSMSDHRWKLFWSL